jgi:hypothetical protein
MIFSDHLNSDGRANPDENIRLGFTTQYTGPFSIVGLYEQIGGWVRRIPLLVSGRIDSMRYDPADGLSFKDIWVPQTVVGPQLSIPVTLGDSNGNLWEQVLSIPVYPLAFRPVSDTVHRVAGSAPGNFSILVVDPLQFTGHRYVISGVDSINARGDHGFTLKDSTDGRMLLLNHPLPDALGHNILVTDGFKVLNYDLQTQPGRMVNYGTPSGSRHWTWSGVINILNLEGMNGVIGNAFDHWPSGGVGYNQQHPVLICYAATDTGGTLLNPADTLASFAYRYLQNAAAPPARPEFAPFIKNPGPGMAYQDYTRSLPFAAYDVRKQPSVRLMLGYLENNVPGGKVDGRYWPEVQGKPDNTDSTGRREWFFIFNVPYSQTLDPELAVDILNVHLPLMWVGYPLRRDALAFSRGDQFEIIAGHPPGTEDRWTFVTNHDDFFPASYTLSQNYPNPFNPITTIQYTLPQPSRVSLKIYSLLGQEVRTLVGGDEYAGVHAVSWDGTNNAGIPLASGVYFCRIDATNLGTPSQGLRQTVKMLLIR